MRVWPGVPYPLGAVWDGQGANFALFSEHASAIELCLFEDGDAPREAARIRLRERTHGVWHAYLPEIRPGQLYGYRADGPWDPVGGHRFNPAKLLLDPYARAITGDVVSHEELPDALPGTELPDPRDDAAAMPKSVVVDRVVHLGRRSSARHALEPHRHLRVPREGDDRGAPGRAAGAAGPLPRPRVRAGGRAPALARRDGRGAAARAPRDQRAGACASAGSPTTGATTPSASSRRTRASRPARRGEQVTEFKTMVKALHRAGIEVLLDVVYNHTAEGDEGGPTLCFRGIDNASYYRLDPERPRGATSTSPAAATASSLRHPRALQLVMDSLRYWVKEMHVDGFRFDLAPALARELRRGRPARPLLRAWCSRIRCSRRVKLIAEPWDLGPGGYQLGRFPPGWAEWNGEYRDTVRRFWRGDPGQLGELASRLSGSADLYGGGRSPHASVNFVTCHDGFTLRDLVSYERKHNEVNGRRGARRHRRQLELELRRRGSHRTRTRSFGCGTAWRAPPRHARLLPGRSDAVARRRDRALAARQQQRLLPRRPAHLGRLGDGTRASASSSTSRASCSRFAAPTPCCAGAASSPARPRRRRRAKDVTWLRPDGGEMKPEDWEDPKRRVLGMLVEGEASEQVDERGRPIQGDTLLVLFNAGNRPCHFRLPSLSSPGSFELALSTAPAARRRLRDALNLVAHSVALLTHRRAV